MVHGSFTSNRPILRSRLHVARFARAMYLFKLLKAPDCSPAACAAGKNVHGNLQTSTTLHM